MAIQLATHSASASPPVTSWSFEWDCGRGAVSALGGMLAPAWFKLNDGREIQPFAIAPWSDESDTPNDMPGILKSLRGEWPCVPFGMPDTPAGLPHNWRTTDTGSVSYHTDPHGASANYEWRLCDHFGTGLEIEFIYPEDHPVERLVRRVEGRNGKPQIDLGLEIHMRRDADLPIGLHPVLALPDRIGAARLELPVHTLMTYPVDTEPGVSRLKPGCVSNCLASVPAQDGSEIDVTNLPLPGHTEELVQVAIKTGLARLENLEGGYTVELNWDAEHFPFCLLWISNKGRAHPPWNNRHCALGIEPVAAAFDLGIPASRKEGNPLAGFGKTVQRLLHTRAFDTRYSIAVEPLVCD